MLIFTRIQGKGCGSSSTARKTKYLGNDTTLMSPVEALIPKKHTAQKSDRISEIQRLNNDQGSLYGFSLTARSSSTSFSDAIRSSNAEPWCPTSCTSDEPIPLATIRSRGILITATGLSSPPGKR